MIIPMVCFTCGKQIAHIWPKYQKSVEKYRLKVSTSKSKETPEFRAMTDHKIGRDCCRRMFMCQHDMYVEVR